MHISCRKFLRFLTFGCENKFLLSCSNFMWVVSFVAAVHRPSLLLQRQTFYHARHLLAKIWLNKNFFKLNPHVKRITFAAFTLITSLLSSLLSSLPSHFAFHHITTPTCSSCCCCSPPFCPVSGCCC